MFPRSFTCIVLQVSSIFAVVVRLALLSTKPFRRVCVCLRGRCNCKTALSSKEDRRGCGHHHHDGSNCSEFFIFISL